MSSAAETGRHHCDNISSVRCQEKAIDILVKELNRVGNPFAGEESELINIATKGSFQ